MNFEVIANNIKQRRSYKPALMNGKKIDDSTIYKLLQLADWAPTHAHTEPWRFIVFANDKVKAFCKEHAALYKANVPTEKFETAKYEKTLHNGDHASHIIAVYMKRGTNPKDHCGRRNMCCCCGCAEYIIRCISFRYCSIMEYRRAYSSSGNEELFQPG